MATATEASAEPAAAQPDSKTASAKANAGGDGKARLSPVYSLAMQSEAVWALSGLEVSSRRVWDLVVFSLSG